MPGVVFLIVVPTANFERELLYGSNYEVPPPIPPHQVPQSTSGGSKNLNINLPENNAILRLEVELRDKNAAKYRRGGGVAGAIAAAGRGRGQGGQIDPGRQVAAGGSRENLNIMVPMEKVLEELLTKLAIEHVTWSTGKKGYYYHVVFPLQSGEPCETTLHCLTELGIGTKFNSSVSVLPCSVSYDAISEAANKDDYNNDAGSEEELSKWNNFVESIKSKLTVKQVVDGVRAGGCLSFDYLLLIVTADSLAALGLVENNAPNIVAAMLVSPLMGPVMSITFGTIISDRELVRVGFITLVVGMVISCVFGFIFGLILGTTAMPWGFNDWPTEEMRGRGNVRSLWMGVLWALTSGTGVAVALLQGSAGPLIGVAISASLLPPVVNCGLFWALACIWLIYPDIKMPHIKGETYYGNSSYEFIYTNYLPTEFLVNGIVSGLLTVVNVICIFITAIIVLKIKEVSAPYTASPDLKRFWETDLRTVRKTNRSTIRQRRTLREKLLPTRYQGLDEPRSRELDTVLEQALKEATDDVTFKKVKRMSYSSNAAGELTQRLANLAGINNNSTTADIGCSAGVGLPTGVGNSSAPSRMNSIRNSKINADLKALDKLVSSLLLDHHQVRAGELTTSKGPMEKLNRWRPLSRSAHSLAAVGRPGGGGHRGSVRLAEGHRMEHFDNGNNNFNVSPQVNNNADASGGGGGTGIQHGSLMPTILEQNQTPNTLGGNNNNSWSQSLERTGGGVRNVFNTIANAPHRFSQSLANDDEENLNLTQNYIA